MSRKLGVALLLVLLMAEVQALEYVRGDSRLARPLAPWRAPVAVETEKATEDPTPIDSDVPNQTLVAGSSTSR